MKNSTAVLLALLVTVAAGASALLTRPDCSVYGLDDLHTDCGAGNRTAPGWRRTNASANGSGSGQPREQTAP
jgi:hypothetical protein